MPDVVERCSSPADNVWTLAPVTSKRPLAEIVGQHIAAADASDRKAISKLFWLFNVIYYTRF